MQRLLRPLSPARPFAAIALAALLAACGGGGGGSQDNGAAPGSSQDSSGATGDATAPANQDTGSVSTGFVASVSGTQAYFYQAIGTQSFGLLKTFTQSSSGAMTALNDTTLTGPAARTQDISGDAFSTQGRWTQGTVNRAGSSRVLAGNEAVHYVAFNRHNAFPDTGTFQCDAGRFTTPTYAGGTQVPASAQTGSASSSGATLRFGSTGAVVSASYTVQAGTASDSRSLNVTIPSPTSMSIQGAYLGGNQGSAWSVGDGGNGTYLVVGAYRSMLSNAAIYQGVVTLRCHS